MGGFNRAHMVGNLTRDPELRFTSSGTAVCDMTLAINEKRKGKSETLFIDVTTFDKTAQACSDHLRKGMPVLVEGRLIKEEWTSKQDGQKRSKMKILASGVHFISGGKGNSDEGQEDQQGDVDGF